ncbi:hypothetical protein CRG98_024043 [Punica granatum]|uniref:Uncharacterized protein n=1 Tax=Punica granatum TaxID=22663 RepID=A0A2I0JHP7_PUNGR|nr:hypothetical protein CRG98_024043 [Punica granatum]
MDSEPPAFYLESSSSIPEWKFYDISNNRLASNVQQAFPLFSDLEENPKLAARLQGRNRQLPVLSSHLGMS